MAQVINAESVFNKRREDNTREKKIEKLNRMQQVFTETAVYIQSVQRATQNLIDELDLLGREIQELEKEILNGE